MKLDPKEAYQTYVDAERTASQAYEQFWVTRFSLANLHFKPSSTDPKNRFYGYGPIAEDGKFVLNMATCPSHFDGVKIDIYQDVAPNGHAVDYHWAQSTKIRSESGFNRFIARLRNNGFQATPSLPFRFNAI